MNLQATVQWAKSINFDQIDQKQRYKAQCYADMIVEKSGTVAVLTDKIGKYMEDIQEYLGQLEKINISPEPKRVEPVVEEKEPEHKSPLLP
jgi:hypothetical protein